MKDNDFKEMRALIVEIADSLSQRTPEICKESLFVLISFVMKAQTQMKRDEPKGLPWDVRLFKELGEYFVDLNKLMENEDVNKQ